MTESCRSGIGFLKGISVKAGTESKFVLDPSGFEYSEQFQDYLLLFLEARMSLFLETHFKFSHLLKTRVHY